MEPYLSEAGLQEMKEQNSLDEFIDAICKEIRTKGDPQRTAGGRKKR